MDADNGVVEAVCLSKARSRIAPTAEFAAFFRGTYHQLLKAVRYVGGTPDEADDAASAAMEEVLHRWDELDNARAYAHRAVLSNFYKLRMRGVGRVQRRMIEQNELASDEGEDDALTEWENGQWICQVFDSLPAAQREIMALVVDGFTPTEISRLLGKSPETVRKNLQRARERVIPQVAEELGLTRHTGGGR